MTHQRLAAARRMMAIFVPGTLPAGTAVMPKAPVPFSLLDLDNERMIFRRIARCGEILDPDLNPMVTAVPRDCIATTAYLSDSGQRGPGCEESTG